MVFWLIGFLTFSSTTRLYPRQVPRQTPDTHETELGDHDFCLSRPHYTDTDLTSRERAATARIKPGTSSPGVARSTDWATPPPPQSLLAMVDWPCQKALHHSCFMTTSSSFKNIFCNDSLFWIKLYVSSSYGAELAQWWLAQSRHLQDHVISASFIPASKVAVGDKVKSFYIRIECEQLFVPNKSLKPCFSTHKQVYILARVFQLNAENNSREEVTKIFT